MSSPIQALVNTQLASSASLLYAAGVGTWVQLSKILVANTDTSSHIVTFHIVPSGGSAAVANKTTIAQAVLAGQSWNDPNEFGLVLNPGDAIWGFADTASVVNCFIAGLLTTG